MDGNTSELNTSARKTPRKLEAIAKSFGSTLPRTGSILNVFMSRKPSLRKSLIKGGSNSGEDSGSQNDGDSGYSDHSSLNTSDASNWDRSPTSKIKQHYLMKPIHPPIPKSSTLCSFETTWLYGSPEASPTRSKRSSISSARLKHDPVGDHRPEMRPVDKEDKSPGRFRRTSDRTPTPSMRPLLPGAWPSACASTSLSSMEQFSGSNNRFIKGTTIRRSTLSPSQLHVPQPLVTAYRRMKKEGTYMPSTQPSQAGRIQRQDMHEITQDSVRSAHPVSASRSNYALSVSRATRPTSIQGSIRIAISPNGNGRTSRIPMPITTPRGMSSASTVSGSGSAERKTRIPTPIRSFRQSGMYDLRTADRYYPPTAGARRYRSRPSLEVEQTRLHSGLKNPRCTPSTIGGQPSNVSRNYQQDVSSEALLIPLPHAPRKGNAPSNNFAPDVSSYGRNSPLANTSLNQACIQSTSSTLATQTMGRTGFLGTVIGAKNELYWLGRFMAMSDRLRTEDISAKATVAAGDPSAADHPANTGMLDDKVREGYVFDQLTTQCGNIEAQESLETFKRKLSNIRAGHDTAKHKLNGTSLCHTIKERPTVFERLRKRSKTLVDIK